MIQSNMREVLLARTITVIADEGLDRTTTKAIVKGTGINEAYIYRHFSDKEDLLAKAFDKLDAELADMLLRHMFFFHMQGATVETRFRLFFYGIWQFLLGNREKCLTYVRYYYSPYFQRRSVDAHRQRYTPVADAFREVFVDEIDVWVILNHILNVMLDSAVKVHNDPALQGNNTYSGHIFRVVYQSVRQYFNGNVLE